MGVHWIKKVYHRDNSMKDGLNDEVIVEDMEETLSLQLFSLSLLLSKPTPTFLNSLNYNVFSSSSRNPLLFSPTSKPTLTASYLRTAANRSVWSSSNPAPQRVTTQTNLRLNLWLYPTLLIFKLPANRST
ncbi:unnamed protein product [Sphenostylis stenocarpa]|uniref:Uncharacterized protein n=1 Tax=Sphenostylis stenocarpa TaxID=92480 RepID=A0AA86V8H4_9FABA|nr:unnamed protein product [Sphenostylis stenocarpa]